MYLSVDLYSQEGWGNRLAQLLHGRPWLHCEGLLATVIEAARQVFILDFRRVAWGYRNLTRKGKSYSLFPPPAFPARCCGPLPARWAGVTDAHGLPISKSQHERIRRKNGER